MHPIQIPEDWPDAGLLTFEEFCDLIRTPQRTVRDWRQRGIGQESPVEWWALRIGEAA